MTERTIRSMAKELAGTFYEENRTPGFRQAFPTFKAYLRGQWHQSDGSIKLYRPGWQHHVELARKVLSVMLGRNDIHINVKNAIFAALIEDRDRQYKAEMLNRKNVKDLPQAGMRADG